MPIMIQGIVAARQAEIIRRRREREEEEKRRAKSNDKEVKSKG